MLLHTAFDPAPQAIFSAAHDALKILETNPTTGAVEGREGFFSGF